MQLTWMALLLLCGLALAGWFWHDSLGARELANAAAQDACSRLQLQFLDGTVAFAGIRLTRGADGWPALERRYVFDYTADSVARRQGFVMVQGPRVEAVGFSPQASQPRAAAETMAGESGPSGPALDLQKWRTLHPSGDGSADRAP